MSNPLEGPIREVLASMPDEVRAQFREQVLRDIDAIDSMSESDRAELESRMKAEAHAREHGPGYVENTPFGRRVYIRRFPRAEFITRVVLCFVGSFGATTFLAPFLLARPELAASWLVVLLALACATGGIGLAYAGFHGYYAWKARQLSGGRKLRPADD